MCGTADASLAPTPTVHATGVRARGCAGRSERMLTSCPRADAMSRRTPSCPSSRATLAVAGANSILTSSRRGRTEYYVRPNLVLTPMRCAMLKPDSGRHASWRRAPANRAHVVLSRAGARASALGEYLSCDCAPLGMRIVT